LKQFKFAFMSSLHSTWSLSPRAAKEGEDAVKKLMNAPDAFVDEMLDGLSAAHPSLVRDTANTRVIRLDSMHALAESLGGDQASAEAALKVAKQALDTLRDRPCRVGRARMYAEKSVGEDDPGMLAFLRLVEAVAAPADNNTDGSGDGE
jgi:hypothetical protein